MSVKVPHRPCCPQRGGKKGGDKTLLRQHGPCSSGQTVCATTNDPLGAGVLGTTGAAPTRSE
jgi:hypothetical protein